MSKIEICHLGNIEYVQYKYAVEEITSFYMAEQLTAEDLGWA